MIQGTHRWRIVSAPRTHHTEQALRESEARFRAMIEDQPDLICRYRSDGTLIFANRAFVRFFGCETAGAAGMDFLGALCGEGGATLARDLAGLCRGAACDSDRTGHDFTGRRSFVDPVDEPRGGGRPRQIHRVPIGGA